MNDSDIADLIEDTLTAAGQRVTRDEAEPNVVVLADGHLLWGTVSEEGTVSVISARSYQRDASSAPHHRVIVEAPASNERIRRAVQTAWAGVS